MAILDEFNNSASWNLKSTATKKAVETKQGAIPIPPFFLGTSFSSRFLAVGISVKAFQDTWRHGGYIWQVTNKSFSLPPTQKIIGSITRLVINQITLVELPEYGESYQLIYAPPRWYCDVTIKVWEYIGKVSDTVPDSFITLKDKINSIELNLAQHDEQLTAISTDLSAQLAAISEQINDGLTAVATSERAQAQAITALAGGIAFSLPPFQSNKLVNQVSDSLNTSPFLLGI